MSIYNGEWTLNQNEYLNSVVGQMDLSSGITMIIADVGTGKSHYFSRLPDVFFIAPLVSIVKSIDGLDVSTWNAKVAQVLSNPNKSEYASKTLVVDECHGLYTDFSYKGKLINDLVKIFPYFKSVILMSGTTDAQYINSVQIDRVYRVRKPSVAMKEIKTYIYDTKGKAVLESLVMASKGKRKAIALVNNVDLCNQVAKSYGSKALVVSSDVKDRDEVVEFFNSKRMTDASHDYDLIIGTDSIREGLSIEDDLDEVDIFIYGHTDPDGIEQFCNRFRNVTASKTVHYIVPTTPAIAFKPFDVVSHTDDARNMAERITDAYRGMSTEHFKEHFRTQYSQDLKGSQLRYNKEQDIFEMNLVSIDAYYYEHRKSVYRHDVIEFQSKLMDYDFNYVPPVVVSGNEQLAEEIKEGLRAIKDERKREREDVLSSLVESYSTGKFKYSGQEEYDGLRESIDKLLKVGLKTEQIEQVVNGYINDESFISKVWSDYNYVDERTNIRNMILYYIAKECPMDELNMIDLYALSGMIVEKVLKEVFNGDALAMMKNTHWKGVLTFEGSRLVAKEKCQTKIINRYITLDKPVRKRVTADVLKTPIGAILQMRKVDRYYVYPVKHTSVSGIEIDKNSLADAEVQREVQNVIDMKYALLALRAA
ncbi:TPA: hypothetical protein ACJIXE_004258 [Serratia marcescens]|uniref:hypothetical protein n=1 Tax=Serratia marcescens TaxID=615 RepID=UPI0038629425